jgi:hypothetical protein
MRPLCWRERRPARHGVSLRELLTGDAVIEGRSDLTLADDTEDPSRLRPT